MVTDGDGDPITGTLDLTLNDDVVTFSEEGTGSPQVDEEGVQDQIGNEGEQYEGTTGGQRDFATDRGNDERTSVTRDLNVLWGADDEDVDDTEDGQDSPSGTGDRSLTFREVEGEGVVGQQPILEPGQVHQYVSGCNLRSGLGKMHGTYLMEKVVDGSQFEVVIPEFSMVVPYLLN